MIMMVRDWYGSGAPTEGFGGGVSEEDWGMSPRNEENWGII